MGGVWTCCLRSSRGRGFQFSLGVWDKRGGTQGVQEAVLLETWVRESRCKAQFDRVRVEARRGPELESRA